MSFTDDDLRQLKKRERFSGLEEIEAKTDDLVARLEAAEKAIKAWQVLSDEWHSRVRGVKDEFEKQMAKANAMEAWRKAAGLK